jgi:hypothetical protein
MLDGRPLSIGQTLISELVFLVLFNEDDMSPCLPSSFYSSKSKKKRKKLIKVKGKRSKRKIERRHHSDEDVLSRCKKILVDLQGVSGRIWNRHIPVPGVNNV